MADNVFGTMMETAQGLQGLGIQQQQLAGLRQAQEIAKTQADAAMARRRAFSDDVSAALADPQQMPALMLKYPEYADHINKGVTALDTQTKSRLLNANARIVQLIDAGKLDDAKQVVQEHADLYGRMPPAILGNEKLFRGATLTQLAASPEGREMIKQMGAAPITAEQNLAERRLSFDINKEVFNQKMEQRKADLQERGVVVNEQELLSKLSKAQNPDLSPGLQKLVDDSVTNSMASQGAAGQMRSLAEKAKQMDWFGGTATEWNEARKTFMGSEDEQSRIIKQIEGVLSKDMLSMLPPGPATDKDVALARKTVMKATANPQELAQSLEAAARLQDKAATFQQAKSEYVTQNGGLGKARRDIDIGDGVTVPAGTSFGDAMRIAGKAASVVWENHPKYGRVTELDIESTMKNNKMSRQQAIDYIRRVK